MKSFLLTICSVLLLGTVASAQVGRHEQPIDTVPIGGQEQENKMTQLQGQERLLRDLQSLRDSLGALLHTGEGGGSSGAQRDSTERDGQTDSLSTMPVSQPMIHRKIITTQHQRLEQMIKRLESSRHDEGLMKEGYVVLNDVRQSLKTGEAAPTKRAPANKE
jgi:hypothetical protein